MAGQVTILFSDVVGFTQVALPPYGLRPTLLRIPYAKSGTDGACSPILLRMPYAKSGTDGERVVFLVSRNVVCGADKAVLDAASAMRCPVLT
eukprot:3027860-Rhodomonas_salina.3